MFNIVGQKVTRSIRLSPVTHCFRHLSLNPMTFV